MAVSSFFGKLSLGPLLYNWPVERMRDFYFRVADEMDVDRVFIGEVVCSKRQSLHEKYIPEIIERLELAGKQVVFSTLALVINQREMKGLNDSLKGIFSGLNNLIEINDIALLSACSNKLFAVGPYVNIYNEDTLSFFERAGARIVTLPFELSRNTIKTLAANTKVELEVQVFGRLPLAISARCYHARAHNIHKDNCQFVCEDDLDGLDIKTINRQSFLTINGTQTQSFTYANLLQEIPDMQKIGINSFRLSPQNIDMVAIVRIFRGIQNRSVSVCEGLVKMKEILPQIEFSNGFYHCLPGKQRQGLESY